MYQELKNATFVDEMIQKYANMIVKIAYQYVHNQPDAEDIMQDVFIKLIECRKQFENEEHIKAWLIRVTINLSINYIKSSWYKKRLPFEENNYSFTYQQKTILEELFQIPYKYRIVLYLYYYENYTLQEIAVILNKSINTVASQLRRAREKLKIEMEENG